MNTELVGDKAKDVGARLAALSMRHANLEQAIETECQRPLPDTVALADLKRQKLRIKDEIARLRVI
ncbi:MAG: DUF465 domain-containing protein [Alphaproteobacteria bacterium]|nr:DUF465 domain-containing protein [Alphaproteobacteria bacterium]